MVYASIYNLYYRALKLGLTGNAYSMQLVT